MLRSPFALVIEHIFRTHARFCCWCYCNRKMQDAPTDPFQQVSQQDPYYVPKTKRFRFLERLHYRWINNTYLLPNIYKLLYEIYVLYATLSHLFANAWAWPRARGDPLVPRTSHIKNNKFSYRDHRFRIPGGGCWVLYANKQTNKLTCKQPNHQSNKQTNKQTNKQINTPGWSVVDLGYG